MRTLELKIHDIAFGGKGVARNAGKAVFVPYTIEQETVSAQLVREKKHFAEAELLEVREASPDRVTPECPYFGRCGGCAYQHIDYEHQLEIKSQQVRDVLSRIGKIAEPPMRPIVASPENYGYRNRITVHVRDSVIGFFRRESNRLIDVKQCPISTEEVNLELHHLRKQRPRDGHYTLRSKRAPRIFTQTNDKVADMLRQLVISIVPPGQDLLIDAYCGAGFFGKALLDRVNRIVGIDWDRFAIDEARKRATDKESYIAGDVDVALDQARSGGLLAAELNQERRSPDRGSLTLIVDPPATGLTADGRRAIIGLAADTLIYVSCDPSTLARDLRELTTKYSIESVTPLDMFPQTAEIEVLVHLKA